MLTLEELAAIAEKLPKTADGQPILPGMVVYGEWEGAGEIESMLDCGVVYVRQRCGRFCRYPTECWANPRNVDRR